MAAKKLSKSHPYHYSVDKNILQQLIDWAVPVALFYLYFNYYNSGKITPSEMIKTSGLMAIALLSLTLGVGPVARFVPALDVLKAHRKFWGVLSFLFLIAHTGLVMVFYFKFNLIKFVDFSSLKSSGIFVGLLGFLILFLVTLTSNKKALKKLDPKMWKAIQTTSYLALILAVAHFYMMEQVNGVLVIKRLLGQITYWFAAAVIIIRLIVLFLPSKGK